MEMDLNQMVEYTIPNSILGQLYSIAPEYFTEQDKYPLFTKIFNELTIENILLNPPLFNAIKKSLYSKNAFLQVIINYILQKSNSVDIINNRLSITDVESNIKYILGILYSRNIDVYNKIQDYNSLLSSGNNIGKIRQILFSSDYGKFAWVRRLGHSMIDYVEILIGGQVIDKHYGIWIDIWYELTKEKEKVKGYDNMIGDIPSLYTYNNLKKPEHVMYIPLNFWFCKESGLYLPLVALQYAEIQLNVKFRKLNEIAYWEPDTVFENNELGLDCSVSGQFIYLEKEERKRIAEMKHEFLIEQVQLNSADYVTTEQTKTRLYLRNPCKEIIWCMQFDKNINGSLPNGERQWYNYSYLPYDYLNYNNNLDNNELLYFIQNNNILYNYRLLKLQNGITSKNNISSIIKSELRINDIIRTPMLDSKYYNTVQRYEKHKSSSSPNINLYSFALYPELVQPSGTINMTKIETTHLTIELDNNIPIDQNNFGKLYIFGTNYNILRILSGMAGLAYDY
jgi:hypothetical protein